MYLVFSNAINSRLKLKSIQKQRIKVCIRESLEKCRRNSFSKDKMEQQLLRQLSQLWKLRNNQITAICSHGLKNSKITKESA